MEGMFSEGQDVTTPRGEGRIVYIDDDIVFVELTNGAEMDFSLSDISAELEEEVLPDEDQEHMILKDATRIHASAVIEIMRARADGIMQERDQVLKGQLRQISRALGRASVRGLQKVMLYSREDGPEGCPVLAIEGWDEEWKRELFLYALFLGSPPSTLATLENDEIRERFASEVRSYRGRQSG